MSFLEIYRFEKREGDENLSVFTEHVPESCANPSLLNLS